MAGFLGRTIRFTYEFTELIASERLVMRTQQRPFPMETTYTWSSEPDSDPVTAVTASSSSLLPGD